MTERNHRAEARANCQNAYLRILYGLGAIMEMIAFWILPGVGIAITGCLGACISPEMLSYIFIGVLLAIFYWLGLVLSAGIIGILIIILVWATEIYFIFIFLLRCCCGVAETGGEAVGVDDYERPVRRPPRHQQMVVMQHPPNNQPQPVYIQQTLPHPNQGGLPNQGYPAQNPAYGSYPPPQPFNTNPYNRAY